jgi:hypothetical protein
MSSSINALTQMDENKLKEQLANYFGEGERGSQAERGK